MQETMDRWYAANYVRQLRQDPAYRNKAVILVEGSSDMRAMNCAVEESRCERVPAFGKTEVVGALSILEKTGQRGVLAVVDSDFWHIDGGEPKNTRNLVATDWHDMECLLIWSRALDRVLGEFLFEKEAPTIDRVRECLVQCARPIGILLWISQKERRDLHFDFKHLPYSTFIDFTADTVDLMALIKASLTKPTHPVVNAVLDLMKKELLVARDERQICRGHDLTAVLALKLGAKWGKSWARSLNGRTVESMLRLAVRLEDFSETKMYSDMLHWEGRNAGYRFLKKQPLMS